MANMRDYTKTLIGGVSSFGREVPPINNVEFNVVKAKGSMLYDIDGNSYIDYILGAGANLLGHAPDNIVEAVCKAVKDGPLPGLAHLLEEEAAQSLAKKLEKSDKIVFCNSGSEAVNIACSIAIKATGKSKIIKFAGGYNGWISNMAYGWPNTTESLMDTNTRKEKNNIVLVKHNDLDDLATACLESKDIAAIVIDPMLANAGCIPESRTYYESLQQIANRHGILIIADEVLTGFRLHAGLYTTQHGLQPDLVTLGKAIGSGMPVAAVAGRYELMRLLENGLVPRLSTYAGNPPVCAAVVETMKILDKANYTDFLNKGDKLKAGIIKVLTDNNIPASCTGYGSVFSIWFANNPPINYNSSLSLLNSQLRENLHKHCRSKGVMVTKNPFGRMFLSFAHSDKNIDDTIATFENWAVSENV